MTRRPKLTSGMTDVLGLIHDRRGVSHESLNWDQKTQVRALYARSLVYPVEYANGPHWELTSLGFEEITRNKSNV